MNHLLFLLSMFMLITCIYGEDKPQGKIKLEDIERDNLVSERQAQLKESFQEQQAPHGRPQSFQTLVQYKSPNSLSSVPSSHGGVVYAKPSSHGEEDAQEQDYEEDGGHQLGHLQYAAPTSAVPAQVYGEAPPVHESPRTYAPHSRQTLLKPLAPTAAASYLRQREQPQFVYVQAAAHHAPEARNLQQVAGQGHYVDESYGYGDGGQPGLQAPSGPQQEEQVYQQPGAINYLQYVPYIARGPADGQSYVMMAPIPAGYQQQAAKQVAVAPSAVGYSHQAGAPPPTAGHLQQGGVQYLTQPTGPAESVEYVGGTGHGEVQATAPGQDIQYADQSQRPSLDKSKQYLFAPKHPEPQILVSRQQQLPRVEYRSSQKVIPLRQTVFSTPQTLQVANVPSVLASRYLEPAKSFQPLYTVSYPPSIDFFHGRDSKSLLDSYIPSWVIIQRQNDLQQQNFATPLVGKYNTISYAVPHSISGHYNKRNAKGKV